MTEFFSNFGKKISNVGQETVKKTKEIAEIGKISSKIKDEEKKLDGLYTELGKKYFSLYSCCKIVYFIICFPFIRLYFGMVFIMKFPFRRSRYMPESV